MTERIGQLLTTNEERLAAGLIIEHLVKLDTPLPSRLRIAVAVLEWAEGCLQPDMPLHLPAKSHHRSLDAYALARGKRTNYPEA